MKKQKVWMIAGVAIVVIGAAGMGLWNYHEKPQFCAACHVMDPYLASWEESSLEAHVHAQEDVACLDCHEPTIKQQVTELISFVTHDYETPLTELKVPQEECLACHEHGNYAELAEATADRERNPHESHWGEMECRLCHKMHKPSELYCTQCHEVDVPDGWTAVEAP